MQVKLNSPRDIEPFEFPMNKLMASICELLGADGGDPQVTRLEIVVREPYNPNQALAYQVDVTIDYVDGR